MHQEVHHLLPLTGGRDDDIFLRSSRHVVAEVNVAIADVPAIGFNIPSVISKQRSWQSSAVVSNDGVVGDSMPVLQGNGSLAWCSKF